MKSPAENEKGVLLIDYTFALSLFAKKFDVAEVARRCHIVLEPTWRGYCDLDILCYARFDFPVFVQTPEPRDLAFLQTIGSNLVPLHVAGNWSVDRRVYRPLPGAAKDIDVVMVACWGVYKRHYRVLRGPGQTPGRGGALKAALVGYPADYTLDEIVRQARHYGVEDQLEFHEHLSPEEVNVQYNRARVNLLWSRTEGFNRAIIEGMCAGVPCILRAGHNYGHHYAYINSQTGCFSSRAWTAPHPAPAGPQPERLRPAGVGAGEHVLSPGYRRSSDGNSLSRYRRRGKLDAQLGCQSLLPQYDAVLGRGRPASV